MNLALFQRTLQTVLILILTAATAAQADDRREKQRQLYLQAQQQISSGELGKAARKISLLGDYPLTSYLLADLMIASLDGLPAEAIDRFNALHGGSIAHRRFTRQWLRHLAANRDWATYLRYYDASLATTELRCHYAIALYHEGMKALAAKETETLWLTGNSQPNVCDLAFANWLDQQPRREELIWQRAQLAIENRQVALLTYLLRLIPADAQVVRLAQNPMLLEESAATLAVNPRNRALVLFSLERIATQDFEKAQQLWPKLDQRFGFSPEQNFSIRQHIARFMIASGDPRTQVWLASNAPDGEDEYLHEWRIRLAMRGGLWNTVDTLIQELPAASRQQPIWRYWQARARIALDGGRASEEIINDLADLANQRGYYSFLAADLLHQRYRIASEPQDFSAEFTALESLPGLQRAKELLAIGDIYWARLEWYQAMAGKDAAQQAAAAVLAQRWGWHSQAIHSAIRGAYWDDLELRFPLAHQEVFLEVAQTKHIKPQWLYAIARQESAFDSRARSPAGARGIMQLMPGTARGVARDLGQNYSNQQLNEPETNILWGSSYFRQMLNRFDGNRILAAAAYNIGPATIERVVSQQDRNYPFDIWIETLPYQETRNYLKNVLAFSVIYAQRLEQHDRLVSSGERYIGRVTETAAAEADASNPWQLPLDCCLRSR